MSMFERIADDVTMRREVKASVFTDLFGKKRYACQLFNDLHPDAKVTEEEIEVVTLQNVLATGQYNDLGFTVGNKMLVLAKAQSTWSTNIVLRSLMYVAETLKNWVRSHRLDLYGSRPVVVPEPEMYVVYTGSKKQVDPFLSLSECSYPEGAEGWFLDARVRVIRDDAPGILGEYVQFAQRADRNAKKCRNGAEAAVRTVRECIEDGILSEYLLGHEE